MSEQVRINHRKEAWYVRLAAGAVDFTGGMLTNGNGPTPFARRNRRFVDTMDARDNYARVVTLRTVHEGRELIAELTPDEAETLGHQLISTAAGTRASCFEHKDGNTDGRPPLQAALDAHKAAQKAALARSSELLRMIWPQLAGKLGQQFLTARDESFGTWRISLEADGSTVAIEARDVPPQAWGIFVRHAVDQAWFHGDDWKGVQDWRTVKPGEYAAQSHRAKYEDALEVAESGTATLLVLRAVEVRKAAKGLGHMLTGVEED